MYVGSDSVESVGGDGVRIEMESFRCTYKCSSVMV